MEKLIIGSRGSKLALKYAEIAKKAYAQSRPIIEVAIEETEMNREVLETLLDPVSLTRGGLGNT